MLQQSDDTCPHVDHLFVVVGNALVDDTLLNAMLCVLIKELKQQVGGLLVGKDLQLMLVLDVHSLIADIVGCLDKIYERVAGIA